MTDRKRIITVKVQTRARSSEVRETGPDEFLIRVTAAPSKGEANREAVKSLARHLGIPPSRLSIIRGRTSSRKSIAVDRP